MVADTGGSSSGADGGPVRHIPVLLADVLVALQPQPGALMLDGTFGAGGYTAALLDKGCRIVAFDRDPDAIAGGAALKAASDGRLDLVHAAFSTLGDHVADASLDGAVFDIGVSSMQIDEGERGFSFAKDGPLDMRMAQRGVSAADVVNRAKPSDLARIFGLLGEERHAGRIARAIDARRSKKPFETTRDLANLIETVAPRKPQDRIHPATRVFQALRIFVNDELGELAGALVAAERALKPGGRLAVVTFHSLEDRIVKRFFQDRAGKAHGSRHLPQGADEPAQFRLSGRQPVVAGEAESVENPRARSAKLRAAIRTDAAPGPRKTDFLPVPALAALAAFGG